MYQNPSKFTLQGTNTYLIGEHNPYILVDTGHGLETYPPFLQEALLDHTSTIHADKPYISDIILSHKHADHCYGLPSVLKLLRQLWADHRGTSPYQPPRIHKIPLHTPDPRMQYVFESLASLPPELFMADPSGNPIHDLHDLQTLPVTTSSADAESASLLVLHTPGHTEDSLCLYYPGDRAIFTADTVLGHGSSVFEDLRTYMASLRRIIDFGTEGSKYGPVYPGHGPVVDDGLRHINNYLRNRITRENQILGALQKSPPPDGVWTTWTLVSSIYADYPRDLWEAAARSVDMHLRKLEAEGRVESPGGEGRDTEWILT
ncbi:lactamase [Wolfiporia cocos MD-104 SS10]|uniref:Lactamase n=1 Tax=Wolfiporia cocos (strain MD-104) TaxID=742152 RepID=A0A2H3JKY2_WOLCO|nr:lactamase [Wolfiporia cocos MD-104 SS10]